MRIPKRVVAVLARAAILLLAGSSQANEATLVESPLADARVLVFSKTEGFRHGSISAGKALFSRLATEHGFTLEFTESQGLFSDRSLDPFDAIVFLNTTGDVLDDRRQRAMQRFIQSGRGYVGIHAAADTERDGAWPWYIRLVGASFAGHPGDPSHIQRARLHVAPPSDPSTQHFPSIFDFVDEWYDFSSLRVQTRTLLYIDRDSYPGSQHSGLTKIAWQQEFDGGRAFYTNLGHRDETYSNKGFIKHLLAGIEFAVGDKARGPLFEQRPDPERFTREVLTQPLNEPVSLDVLSDGSVLIVERRGLLKKWLPSGETLVIGEVPDIYYPGQNSEFGFLAIAGVEDAEGLLQGAYFMANRKTEGQVSQHVSYAPLTEGRIDFSSSRLIIELPVDDTCCHTGGSIRFGPDGALYIGVGDNSNPHGLGGYAPLSRDDMVRDARRSAGDTMDLRGKILRILPSPSGSYEVPEGNLFTDADEGRPEIYVMGARNPYTIGFDWDTGDLYYGDVGPDAHLDDPAQGSKGFDEVNRVTRAGNFGWPFLIGDNYSYRIIDEETGEPGKLQDPLRPINNSARNRGAKILPPAEPALIWYPYSRSKKFHELGQGGRNALTAGVYRRADHPAGAPAWPAYFDGKVIVSDFMRRHLIAITLDESGRGVKLESLAENVDLPPPLDLEFGPEGALYVLQYGTRWWQGNEDAGLSRIVFNGDGNRAPVVAFSLDAPAGAAPLALSADPQATYDPDGDPLELSWAHISLAPGQVVADAKALFDQAQASESSSFVFREPGLHAILMRAMDDRGAESFGHAFVNVGNEPPSVTIKVSGNRSLLWPENGPVAYSVEIEDAEDGSTADGTIAKSAVDVQLSVRKVSSVEDLLGLLDEGQAGAHALGLMELYACQLCHQTTASSLGPAYRDVAERYASQDDAREALANSITKGGAGQWGEAAMPAYDFLSKEEINALTGYILGLGNQADSLPAAGEIDPGRHLASDSEVIEIRARYVDRGYQGAAPLEATDQVRLRGATIPLASMLPRDGGQQEGVRIGSVDRTLHAIFQGEGTALPLGEYDLTNVAALRLLITDSDSAPPGRLRLELRARHVGGELLGATEVSLSAPSVSQSREAVLEFARTIDDFRELFLLVSPVSAADAKALISIKTATFVQRGGS